VAALTRRAAAALLAVALLAGCGAAQWKEADARLNAAAAAARAAGYRPMAGPHNTFGAFRRAGSEVWRVRLAGGRPAFIASGCTEGCTSLDFEVADSAGAVHAADTSQGTTPRLEIVPADSGVYLVTFRYGPCRTRGCRWVAQVYER
jgi:hypothetical protein